MPAREYLVRYGIHGLLGCYRAAAPLELTRGDDVVIRSSRGVEIGTVLRPFPAALADCFPTTGDGPLLRRPTSEDRSRQLATTRLSTYLLARGQQLIDQLGLSLALLEAEVLLEGDHAILHGLVWDDTASPARLVKALGNELSLSLDFFDLRPPQQPHMGCGSCGGCGSCSSKGCKPGRCGGCSSRKPTISQMPTANKSPRISLL
jgi:hypothetical protein